MAEVSKEERMKLAIKAFNQGQFQSKTSCAQAFDVPSRTLMKRLNGVTSRKESIANGRKLSDIEETTLSRWILDMHHRGLPLQISNVRYLAQLLLSARMKPSNAENATIGELWVNRFIKRHPELKSKYTRPYDYQRAKCEDPELIKNWFNCVQETIQKYGISEQDIYNMDETGFQIGVASTAKVVCGSETRDSHAKFIQPGNREWITIIIAINASGSVLPPQIIFAGKKHQSQWYSAVPKEYRISMSDNGWTNDGLGFEWLQEIFEKYTFPQTAGRYRLLVLDGHSSHATASFDHFCMERRIIPLYMPPHSSHLLQPLDISCFAPLKHYYGQKIREMAQNGIHAIDKMDFLSIYTKIHGRAFSTTNISSGFTAAGLIPLKPERVLAKLNIKTPTPPSSSSSNQSFYLGRTPANLYQLNQQKKQIQDLQQQSLSSVVAEQTLGKIIKGAEMAMQNSILLQQEIHQLHMLNRHQKEKKKITRAFIQDGGSLTGGDGQQRLQEREALQKPSSRCRRPARCSNCNKEGHNRLKCPTGH